MALNETLHAGGFLLSEAPFHRSRENGTLNSGQDLAAGTVLGRLLTAGAATAVGTPTGNGAITVGAIGRAAKIGVYKLVCVAAAANAGTFNFYAPDGTLVRQITVGGGATANDHITLTIADGATDFAAGDSYTVTVTGGDYEVLDPAEDDGAQIAAGILLAAVDASAADAACAVIVRDAEVLANELTWPAGIADADKAYATSLLAQAGIVIR
jgi:hypothetical protein